MTKATYTRIAKGIEMIDTWEEWGGFYYTIYEYLEEIYSYKLPFDWFDILWKAGFRPEREEGKEFYISSPMQILEYIPHLRTNYLPELEDGEECEYEYPITMEIQSKYFRKADRMINKILELAEKKWNEPKLQLLYLERKCEHLGKQIIEKDYEIKNSR